MRRLVSSQILFFIIICLPQYLSAYTASFYALPSLDTVSEFLSVSLEIASVSFDSDVVFSQQEFFDLTQLCAGRIISAQLLHKGLAHLFAKNKFHVIVVDIQKDDDGRAVVHYIFTGLWTFEQIKITGIWVGREWYKQYYLMEPGDRFDEDKHRHSMQKIKESCRRNGFFNVETQSSLSYHYPTKAVTVHSKITHGKRFVVRNVTLHATADSCVMPSEINRIDRLIYKKYLRPLRNRKYSQELLQEQARAIKKFLAHQGFLYVSIELNEKIIKAEHAVQISWHINIHKKRTFIFFGNSFFSSSQLLDRMLQFGRSAWMLPASILAEELTSAYHKKGFWHASITTREEAERSFFVIKEGTRVTIDEVQLRGVNSFSERMLIRKCFSKLKRRSYFDQKVLERSLDLLMGYYVGHGFLQCKLVGHAFVPGTVPGSYTIVVTMDEGVRTVISQVCIPEFESLVSKAPFIRLNKKNKLRPFDTVCMQEQKQWLLNELQKTGYLYATVKPELIANEDGTSTLCWHLFPGEKVQFGKTILHGSSNLAYEYIQRELAYKQGQLWNQQLVRDSFVCLKQLRVFDSVSFAPLPSDVGNERPILVKVHEDDPFEIRVRAGLEFQHIQQYQTFAGLAYKVGGTFIMKNPTNNADQLQFDANVARSHREITMKYWYPWIFGLPLNGLMQGYSIAYDQPGFIGSKKNIYTIFQNGFLIGLRRKIPWVDFGLNLGFELSRTKISSDDVATQECAHFLACAINFDPRLLNKRIPFVFFEPTVIFNFLDNDLNPHFGTFWVFSIKGMFPTNEMFQDSFLVKLLLEHSSFFSLGDAVTFALRVRFGHIFHREFCDITPNERFYLGGAHSVRSYQADHAPPLGCFVDCEGKACTVPRGGKTMFNLNAEARIATFKDVQLVLFQDIGVLSGDNFEDFTVEKLVAGTGFGLRYLTPIGPLRFDIAWKWKKQVPDEPRTNWFLTFGQAF